MRYADTLLAEGEVIVLRTRQHWLALFLDARAAVVLWVLGLVLLGLVVLLNLQATASQLVSGAALVALALGLVMFLYKAWQWWAQDYMVTNRRLMKVTGILNKRSSDSSLEKINDAILDQNLLGRLLNYGDLDILTASDSAVDYFRMLNGAKEFKRIMLNQKHALEMGMAYERPPSPPLRATPMTMNGETSASTPALPTMGAATATTTAPTTTAPTTTAPSEPMAAREGDDVRPSDSADESLEITQTLARLADLRDRGAIEPAEYEAKKQELLGRL